MFLNVLNKYKKILSIRTIITIIMRVLNTKEITT